MNHRLSDDIKSTRLGRAMSALLWLLAITISAWLIAQIYWSVNSPPVVQMPRSFETDVSRQVQQLNSARLFAGQQASPTGAIAASALNIQVIGIATGFRNGPGFAILQINGAEPRGYAIGDNISNGVHLTALNPDSVIINDGSSEHSYPLQTPKSGSDNNNFTDNSNAAAAQITNQNDVLQVGNQTQNSPPILSENAVSMSNAIALKDNPNTRNAIAEAMAAGLSEEDAIRILQAQSSPEFDALMNAKESDLNDASNKQLQEIQKRMHDLIGDFSNPDRKTAN